MTTDRRSTPLTLHQARCAVQRSAPAPDAPAAARSAHHLDAASLYRRVAETDLDHQHEAMAYAVVEETIYAAEATKPVGCSCRYRGHDDQVHRTPNPQCTVHNP